LSNTLLNNITASNSSLVLIDDFECCLGDTIDEKHMKILAAFDGFSNAIKKRVEEAQNDLYLSMSTFMKSLSTALSRDISAIHLLCYGLISAGYQDSIPLMPVVGIANVTPELLRDKITAVDTKLSDLCQSQLGKAIPETGLWQQVIARISDSLERKLSYTNTTAQLFDEHLSKALVVTQAFEEAIRMINRERETILASVNERLHEQHLQSHAMLQTWTEELRQVFKDRGTKGVSEYLKRSRPQLQSINGNSSINGSGSLPLIYKFALKISSHINEVVD
jgi:hypothetical protein